MDVTNLYRGLGLSEAQLSRLDALERSTNVKGFEAGEAQFYATQGTPAERERALRVAVTPSSGYWHPGPAIARPGLHRAGGERLGDPRPHQRHPRPGAGPVVMTTLVDQHPLVKAADAKLADLEKRRTEFEANVAPLAAEDAKAEAEYHKAVDAALLEGAPMPPPLVRQLPEGRVCPGPHEYVQHRAGRPPYCKACSYTDVGLPLSDYGMGDPKW